MTPRRPRDIGTATETAAVRYLTRNGFPHAERRQLRGRLDCGDITGTPGITWEVKGGNAAKTASDTQVAAWLVETERERVNAGADIGVLVLQRAGIGPANAGRWWAVLDVNTLAYLSVGDGLKWIKGTLPPGPVRLHLSHAVQLLRDAGYGTPNEQGVA